MIPDERDHLPVGMSIKKPYGNTREQLSIRFNQVKVSFFLYWQNIFFQEGGLFAIIGICGPFPLLTARVIDGIFKSRYVICFMPIPADCATTMIEMHMCKDHVGNIIRRISCFCKRPIKIVISV